jgi:hypothetical protein
MNTTQGAANMNIEQITETVAKTINEFARRANEVGMEQAITEAAEFHPGAAMMIMDFLNTAKEMAA